MTSPSPRPTRYRWLSGIGLAGALLLTIPASAGPAHGDLQLGPSRQRLGPHEITLTLAPRPIRPMQEQTLTVLVTRGNRPVNSAKVTADLTMVGMDMGPNRPSLKPVGRGRYEGKAVFPACHSGSLDWEAAITLETAGQRHTAIFPVHLQAQD